MKKLLLILLCLPLLFTSCSMQTEKEKELTEICNNINSITPMMVNETFEFSSINCDFPIVNLKYRYVTYEGDGEAMNNAMKKIVSKEVEEPINNHEGFKDFREAGYTFFIEYFDKDFQKLFSFYLRKSSTGVYKIVELKKKNGEYDLVEKSQEEEEIKDTVLKENTNKITNPPHQTYQVSPEFLEKAKKDLFKE